MTTTFPPELDSVFSSLANKHRREIVYSLSLQPHSLSQLATMRGLTLPALHKHIKVLEKSQLIESRKLGRTQFLSLRRRPLRMLQEWILQFNPYWGTDNQTLDNYQKYLNRE